MEKMREEFETWWSSTGHSGFVTNSAGNYVFSHTQTAWISWKASRAALCVELPDGSSCGFEGDSFHAYMCGVDSCKAIIDEAGVNHK